MRRRRSAAGRSPTATSTRSPTCSSAVSARAARHAFWRHVLAGLKARAVPDGMPRYGYLLENAGVPVGAILLIFAATPGGEAPRANVSSWYVEPAFRGYAPLLVAQALKLKPVTYLNVSAVPHTLADPRGAGLSALQQRRLRRGAGVAAIAAATTCACLRRTRRRMRRTSRSSATSWSSTRATAASASGA